MRQEKQLLQNLNIQDVCLIRYNIGDEKKSLLASIIEIDEFSEYHPVKLICKIESDELAMLDSRLVVSLVVKKPELQLYILLKGLVFQKSMQEGYAVFSITDVQLFTKEKMNNISSFKKINKLSVLPAA